jgi:hypothetical protein
MHPDLNLHKLKIKPEKLWYLILLFILFAVNLKAQHELSIGGSIDKPLGELAWTNKSGKGINLGYSFNLHSGNHKVQSFAIGMVIGYTTLPVLSDTLYFLEDPDSYGTAIYSAYSILSLDFEPKLVFKIKSFRLYGAIDLGLHYTKYSYQIHSTGIDLDELDIEGKVGLGPKVGLQYMLCKNIGLYVDFKYNMIISIGSSNIESMNYNPNLGQFNSYISSEMGLVFKLFSK